MPLATEAELQHAYKGVNVAGGYVQLRFSSELHRLLHDRQVAAVQRELDRLRSGAALEIAPGPGRVTRDLKPFGPLVCLEYNEGMIDQGQRVSPPGTVWVRGNGFQLPFGSSFDLVYSFRFVRHFQLEDRGRLYSEVRRVLRPGGCFLMDAVNERTSRPLREAQPEDYPIYDELHTADALRAELREAGFDAVELAPVQKKYRWQYRSQVWLGPRANWLNRLLIRALERLPGRDGLEWIVTCRRA